MIKGKIRLTILFLLTAYTLLLIYLLFVGFGRESEIVHREQFEYAYDLTPDAIRSFLPSVNRNFQAYFFHVGNLVGFIPIGMFIPFLFKSGYIRFIVTFGICITLIELIQMLTMRGSFDINDIILNSLGAIIGFIAAKIGSMAKKVSRKLLVTAIVAVILTSGMIAAPDVIDTIKERAENRMIP
jgi:glycopeptide antibiotics resistance protein